MTDKRNYTGRIEDLVQKAQDMQDELLSIIQEYLKQNGKEIRVHRQNHKRVKGSLDKMYQALCDFQDNSNIDFNIP